MTRRSATPAATARDPKVPQARTDLHAFLCYGGFGEVATEYGFHPQRKWRADWALLEPRVLVEYEGIFHRIGPDGADELDADGRAKQTMSHGSTTGILRDIAKYNAALEEGWVVIRANAKNVADGSVMRTIETVVARRRRELAAVAGEQEGVSDDAVVPDVVAAERVDVDAPVASRRLPDLVYRTYQVKRKGDTVLNELDRLLNDAEAKIGAAPDTAVVSPAVRDALAALPGELLVPLDVYADPRLLDSELWLGRAGS